MVLAGAAPLTLLALLVGALLGDAGEPYLAVSGVAAAVPVAAFLHGTIRQRRAVASDGVVPTVAGLAFAGLVFACTASGRDAERAALLVLVGAVHGGVVLALRRSGVASSGAQHASFVQAVGAGLAAAAIASHGPTVTALWGAVAVVAALASARAGERVWLGAALAALGFVVGHAIYDAAMTATAVERFAASGGSDGALAPPRVIANGRALSMGLAAAGLFGAAAFVRRERGPGAAGWARVSTIALVGGHVVALALIVLEVRDAFTRWPAPPPDAQAAGAAWEYLQSVEAALSAQSNQLGMLTTLVLAVYATAVLVGGFAARSVRHRYIGLGGLTITLAKLAGHDVWELSRPYQIVVLTGVGALLLAAGFLYARFGNRLIGILR
jgi:hypothetical protein